jgi:small neutral amino acid transporter SnatA (MarC family)
MILAGAIILVSLLTLLTLWFVAVRSKIISGIALKIMGRLMGLILAAIAVQFILNGVLAAHLFS